MGGHNDRVADRQEKEELLGKRGQGWHRVRLDHQGELELVESCLQPRIRWDHRSRRVPTRERVVAKILPGDAAPLEDHLVLGEGAGLVAEHVLHLAKLLGDVERPALHPLLVHLVPHQRVVVDQPDLRDLGQLDGDVEGEGDDDLEDDDERPEGEEAGPKGFKLVEGEKAMKGSEGGERVEPKTAAGGAKKAKCEEYQDAPDHLQVDLPLQLAPLVPRTSVVQHRLGLVAGVDDQALDVVGVLEQALSQQEVVLPHRDPLAPGLDQRAVEPVDLGGGRVALQLGAQLQWVERSILRHLQSTWDLPLLQIRLSVKILSVDVAETRGIAAVKKKDVCGDLLVVGQVHDVPDPHLLPQPLHKLALDGAVHPARGVVHLLVARVPTSVLKEVLDCCHDEDEDDRDHGDLLAKGVDGRHPVEQDDEEEVEVGKAVELLEQVPGNEAEQGVLGRPDPVVEVGRVGLVHRAHRNVVVRHNLPVFPSSGTKVLSIKYLVISLQQ